jgi:hypothetical protein
MATRKQPTKEELTRMVRDLRPGTPGTVITVETERQRQLCLNIGKALRDAAVVPFRVRTRQRGDGLFEVFARMES